MQGRLELWLWRIVRRIDISGVRLYRIVRATMNMVVTKANTIDQILSSNTQCQSATNLADSPLFAFRLQGVVGMIGMTVTPCPCDYEAVVSCISIRSLICGDSNRQRQKLGEGVDLRESIDQSSSRIKQIARLFAVRYGCRFNIQPLAAVREMEEHSRATRVQWGLPASLGFSKDVMYGISLPLNAIS